MLGQKTYIHKIKHKCPFCNEINYTLETRQIYNEPNIKFECDFVMSEYETEIYFISCFTYCDECGNRYEKRIGIKNSRITNVVI